MFCGSKWAVVQRRHIACLFYFKIILSWSHESLFNDQIKIYGYFLNVYIYIYIYIYIYVCVCVCVCVCLPNPFVSMMRNKDNFKLNLAGLNSVFILIDWLPYQGWKASLSYYLPISKLPRRGFELGSPYPLPTRVTTTSCELPLWKILEYKIIMR